MTAAAGAAAGAAAAAALANAVKASGVIVTVTPVDFGVIVQHADAPLVVWAETGMFKKQYVYLTSYKGLAFHTQSPHLLPLPPHAETVRAKKIWVPS
jgi:hypothetical protein